MVCMINNPKNVKCMHHERVLIPNRVYNNDYDIVEDPRLVDSCYYNRDLCHINSDCIAERDGTYKCVCREGYLCEYYNHISISYFSNMMASVVNVIVLQINHVKIMYKPGFRNQGVHVKLLVTISLVGEGCRPCKNQICVTVMDLVR